MMKRLLLTLLLLFGTHTVAVAAEIAQEFLAQQRTSETPAFDAEPARLSAEADFQDGIAALDRGDYVTAFAKFKKGAESGNADAQYKLGVMYVQGLGVPKDDREAVRWYTKAAEAGNARAQYILGVSYDLGLGVAQDYGQAARWFTKGAEAGDRGMQFLLGSMYEEGLGVLQDYVQAHKWYNIATAGTNNSLKRDKLAEKMTPEQIGEAQRLAREWKPKTPSPARPREASGSQPAASGTGFVISRQGHVLTNDHVIEGCKSIHVASEGRKQPLTVVATDSENDLALLKLPAPSPNIARFREGRTIMAGDGVVAVGFPLHGLLAAEANVTTGTVSALAGLGNDTRFLQITAPIQPGNSGGPLLDQGGHIVGVIVSSLNAFTMAKATGSLPQNVNFAINGAVAKAFLDANSVEYEVASSGKRLETSDVGVQAKKFTLLLECFQ